MSQQRCHFKRKDNSTQTLTICQLNLQSLPAHFQDLESCKSLANCDIIGLAETWLHPGCQSENYSLDGFASSEETGKIYTIIVSSQSMDCVTIKVELHCMSSLG